MIEPIYLIVLMAVVVVYFISKMISRGDDMHAFVFFMLYLYSIFAQVGYAYYPEASILLGAYFGPDIFYQYWLFIFLSFVFSYWGYRLIGNPVMWILRIKVTQNHSYGVYLFYFYGVVLYFILLLYFETNKNLFGWGGASPMGSQWFAIGYKFLAIYCLALFSLFRNGSRVVGDHNPKVALILLLMFAFLYVSVATAAGSRSDLLYMFLAIIFYELNPFGDALKKRKTEILIYAALSVFMVKLLLMLSELREQAGAYGVADIVTGESSSASGTDEEFVLKILMQDYYSPSHTLFVSLQYNVTDFFEVLKSNLANSLIFLKYPYLTETITSIVDSRTERGVGWAYHLFVEGYNALGWFGFIYNAVILNLGIQLWLLLIKTNNLAYNKLMFAILSIFIVNVVRSQSSVFIQFYWILLIPAAYLSSLALGLKVKIVLNNKIFRIRPVHS